MIHLFVILHVLTAVTKINKPKKIKSVADFIEESENSPFNLNVIFGGYIEDSSLTGYDDTYGSDPPRGDTCDRD